MASSLRYHILIFFSTITIATSRTFEGDIEALKSIQQAIDPASIPPGSCLSSWDFAFDPCDSSFSDRFTCGLRCDLSSNTSRVTEISLDSAGYSGALPPYIWSLPFLETLDLADNRFFGDFPSPPSSSVPIRRLTLSRNYFSGEIPSLSPAASLEEAYLDNNFFSGPIKYANLAQLQLLRRLELQNNNLTGGIPDLTSLSSLNYLDASSNDLTGTLAPDVLPPSLVEISLRNNRLTGELPGPAIANLGALQVMDLSHNGFWGTVPKALFQHPALEQVTVSYNQLQRIQEPSDMGVGSQLVALDLGHNGLTGLLPGFIGSMPRLSAVDLQDNKFTGMIPVQYAMRAMGIEGLAPFSRLLLSGNYLFGPIPGPMGSLKAGSAVVSLTDNCLFRCPPVFFFCEDGRQKPSSTCREFNPVIP